METTDDNHLITADYCKLDCSDSKVAMAPVGRPYRLGGSEDKLS